MASASGCGSKERDEWVLSHGDVVLVRSDLAILRGPRFINDRIIAFYFAHLSAGLHSDDLLLLPPSIPYLLSNLPDTPSVAEGGFHWTLLVLDRATSPSAPRFVHHDSLRGAPNLPIAAHLADALRPLLQCDSGTLPLVQGHTPRQTNGYDCGVYVMAIARAICAWWNDAQDHRGWDWLEAMRREVDARSVKAMRTDLLQLINTLIQEKAKPNSASEGDTDRRSSDS